MDNKSKKNTTLSHAAWLLNEMDYAGRENLDSDHVTRYDKKEDAKANEELQILKEFGLNQQSVVVDFGAGTGQFTLAAASECDQVIAVDISTVMLDVLRAKVIGSGVLNVEVVQSGFLTYEHSGRDADFVYSRFALHHLPDFWKAIALKRIRSIMKPGGVLRLWDVVYNFEPIEAEKRLENWCSTIDTVGSDKWSRSDIEEHIREEHSTFTWLFEPMIERSDFKIEQKEYSPDGIFARYIARAV